MSSNTQVQVHAREHFSIERSLGPGGGKALRGVLEKLSTGGYTTEIREQLRWGAMQGQQHVYTRRIEKYDVLLDLSGTSPRLTVSGVQQQGTEIEVATLRAAHAAVNQVLALAATEVLAEKLSTYASDRISERIGERVTESVALKALEMQQSRLAIRASCRILVNA